LDEKLKPLKEALINYKVEILIGASGSFDTIADMSENVPIKVGFVKLNLQDFEVLKQSLITKNLNQRLNKEGLNIQRADMIIVALLIVDYIVKNVQIKTMHKSDFALKEGVIWAYLNKPEYLQ